MSRAEAASRVLRAQERYRDRVSAVKWWERNTIASATRTLARELAAIDVSKSLVLGELADLLEVPPARRDPPAPASVRARDLAQPPDLEGDEHLHERMNRMRQNGGPR